jgi:hypothetical protein
MAPQPPRGDDNAIKEDNTHSWVECKTWDYFKSTALPELFQGAPFHRGRFLFRGQRSFKFPLKPSFERWFSGRRSDKKRASERLLEIFEEEIAGLPVDPLLRNAPNGVLALAQHHGVPTRLLDWTESPYIAAFFAFEGVARLPDPDPPSHVAIWCLDQEETNVWDSESGAQILHVPGYGNERLRRQLGWFTLLNAPYDTLEEYVKHFSEASEALRQFQVPTADAKQALADLEMMGITYSTIYPGLDGSAKAAELRARWTESLTGQLATKPDNRRRSGERSKR